MKTDFLYTFKKIVSKNRIVLEFFVFLKGFLRGGIKGGKTRVLNLRRIKPRTKPVPCRIPKSVFVQQSTFVFEKKIKFSILVPLYNTPLNYLKEMIESVKNQTYTDWELCLADGSDSEHKYVEDYCTLQADNDFRIVYKKLKENLGISANTNECIQMSNGDYIALFDHDDVLHPSALFECMKAICEQNADYVYTDEVVFLNNKIKKIITYHFKPDYAPENLLANNYICHFSVFNSKLLNKAGIFRSEFDGSQDHDLILRLTKFANKVVHIPKVLYYWRSHSNSVAMDINSKKYAIDAGIAAVQDFLNNNGFDASVKSSPAYPVIYKIDYKITDNPLISIVITCDDNVEKLKSCINSIIEKTSYKNYEIIVVAKDNSLTLHFNNTQIPSTVNFRFIKCENSLTQYSMFNYAAKQCRGDYLLFLHPDMEIVTSNWTEELLMYAQRNDIGAVGGKILLNNDTVEHGGYILGLGENHIADNSHAGVEKDNLGYMGKMFYVQNISAVSDACLMVKKSVFERLNGFDEEFSNKFGDIDFCIRLRENNLYNIFNPYCVINHNLVKETCNEIPPKDIDVFKNKWSHVIENVDPYYNPNFSQFFSYLI